LSNSEEDYRSIPELTLLHSKYEAAVESQVQKTIKPLENLFKNYEARIEILIDNFQKLGNLEGVVAARNAIELEPKTSNINTKFEDISKLQKIFISEKKKIIDLDNKAQDVLLKKYLTALDALKKKITQEGRIDDAIYVDKFITEINNHNNISEPDVVSEKSYTPTSDFVFELKDEGLTLTKYIGKNQSVIIIPPTYKGKEVKVIGSYAFQNIQDIRSITLPDSIKKIENNSISSSRNLERVILSKSLKEIGESAFQNSHSLRTIKLPLGLQKIDNAAFAMCWALKSIEIPNTVTDLGEAVFYQCKSLEKVILSESIETIKKITFADTKIKHIELPENVKTLGASSFRDCESLELVTIKGLESIEDMAFLNCGEFKLIFNCPPPKLLGENIFSGSFPIIERPFGVSGWSDEWAGFKVNVIR